jgi:hypothetical protein
MRYLKDLLLTDRFFIKGHINTGGQRLSTFLNSTSKRLLEMEEVTLVKLDGEERVLSAWMQVRVDEIILAHEMEAAGDEGLRLLAERGRREEIAVTAHFSSNAPLQLLGKVSKRAIDCNSPRPHDFIVVLEPKLRGLTGKLAHEYAVFENLPYVIVNKNRLAFIFQ